MSWWRRRPEVRGESSFTETRLLEQFTRAVSSNVRHGALGGLQCAASAIARAFAAAGVENDDGLLDATTLYSMGFDLVREGQSIWLLDVGTGRPRLSRASTGSDVYEGAADRESWTYRLTLPGPSVTTTVRASADRVIHIRQNSDPTCPWRGRSGLEVAQSSGGLASTLVHALTAEGEVPVSRIIPQPQGDSQSTANSIRNAITTGLRLALPETVAAGGGSGRASAPLTDWKPYRLGPDYMAGGVELHALALQEVASVCGLPPALAPGAAAAGPALRESFRQFVALTVQPLGRILEAEVSRVMERPVRLIHHELASADVVSRARAYKALIENDVDKARALELVGWAS